MLFDDQIYLSTFFAYGHRLCAKPYSTRWTAPDHSTLCRRQKQIDIAISYQKSHEGLHLLVDSTGLKFLGEGEWKRKKHQPEYRRQSRKLHIGIDAKTLQIRAVQLTTNNVSDSQVLDDLLNHIPSDERIDSVYKDEAYDTKLCRQVISDRHAHAVIPPRKNAKPWKDKKLGYLKRNELLKTVKRLGRRLWKKWSGYHRRSLVETKMHCIKLLGEKIHIGILYPIRPHHYNPEGREVKYTDINDWLVGGAYGESGVNQCRKDERPVIKLD